MEFMNNTTATNETLGGTSSHSGSSSYSFYISLALIFFPGIVINSFALFCILKDVKKAVLPAIVLLLALCTADLVAVTTSLIRHTLTRYVHEVTYSMCAALSFVHIFFRVYAGVINSLMAIDRYLAICTPFFYKTNIQTRTWKIGSISGAILTAIYCLFPFMGLGNVWKTVYMGGRPVQYCTSFSYFPEVHKRLYGILYGVIGLLVVLIICTCNILVIRNVIRLNNRIVSVQRDPPDYSDSPTRSVQVTSFEIAFAKLMGCLAAVYLITGTPYNALILLQQVNYTVPSAVKGGIHLLGGLGYTIDPIVYILIRKTTRRRLVNILLRCKFRKDDGDV